jgi:hypothetical protein
MADKTLADKLNEAAGGGRSMSSFDGEVITVVGIEVAASQFDKNGKQVTVSAVTSDGDEVTFYATPTGGRQLIAIEEDLPQDLLVESFPGQFGKTGYKFVTPAA